METQMNMGTVWNQIYNRALSEKLEKEQNKRKEWQQDKQKFEELYRMLLTAFPKMVEFVNTDNNTLYSPKNKLWNITVKAGEYPFTVCMFREEGNIRFGILAPHCQPFLKDHDWMFEDYKDLVEVLKKNMTLLAEYLVDCNSSI